jgi:hypothetical protein
MHEIIGKAALEARRIRFKPGTRVELVHMGDDPYSQLKPGDRGVTEETDDIGTTFVRWDSGSGLGMVFGVDEIKVVPCITDTLLAQIEGVRKIGSHNMLDVHGVQREANDQNFYELVVFLEEHRDIYTRFLFSGQRE